MQVPEEFKNQALAKIRALVKGNGCAPEEVKLESFEGEVLQFQTETELRPRIRESEKIIAGRQTAPEKVESREALKTAIDKEYQKIILEPDMNRKIREVFINRGDLGFAQDKLVLKLPFWQKSYVIYEDCNQCRGKGGVDCRRCAGKGQEKCPQCRGSGKTNCIRCSGQGRIHMGNNQFNTCPGCNGSGQILCPLCHSRGVVQCRACAAKGKIQCANCQGHAVISHVFALRLEVMAHFTYNQEVLPDKICALIERLGPKMREHAEIYVSQIQPSPDQYEKEEASIYLRHEVILPYGHFKFSIKDEEYYAFLFGNKASLTHVSPFLEKLIKPGIRKLDDAAQQRGDPSENLLKAAQYRTIREAVIYAALYGAGHAAKRLKRSNDLGLGNNTIKKLIGDAGLALRHITRRQRRLGLAGGLVFEAALLLVWFMSGARAIILLQAGPLLGSNAEIALDALVLFIAGAVGWGTVKISGIHALRKIMRHLVPANICKKLMPKTGKKGTQAILSAIVLFFAAAYIAAMDNPALAPHWLGQLIH